MKLLAIFSLFFCGSQGLAKPDYHRVSLELLQKGKAHPQRVIVELDSDQKNLDTAATVHQLSLSVALKVQGRWSNLVSSQSDKLGGSLDFYYLFEATQPMTFSQASMLLTEFLSHSSVKSAHLEPLFSLAGGLQHKGNKSLFVSDYQSSESDLLVSATPDFSAQQFHLKPPPQGVGLSHSENFSGGSGEKVRIVDVEIGWQVDHEDFSAPFFEFLQNDISSHGTAVWGIVSGQHNGYGIKGIAPKSSFGVSSVLWEGTLKGYVSNVVEAIDRATDQLRAGDVIIIEQQAPGPQNSNHAPIEYWPAIFDAISQATAQGIHVVAASGNGNSNLDHPDYQQAFDKNFRDSGAILVAAAGSPLGSLHHRRLSFSNYGSRIDAFSYGQHMVTTGYGDLFDQGDTRVYTKGFAGTSSATPIVAGVVAVVSSVYQEQGKLLTPNEVRKKINQSGLKQKSSSRKNIGRFPVLKDLLPK